MPRFTDELKRLGYGSYADYLASDHWLAFKAKYKSSGHSMRCEVCGIGRIQLHHHTYVRIGAERLTDVTPLYRQHHIAVHDWLKTSGRNFVEYSHEAIATLRGVTVVKRRTAEEGKAFGLRMRELRRNKKNRKYRNRPMSKADFFIRRSESPYVNTSKKKKTPKPPVYHFTIPDDTDPAMKELAKIGYEFFITLARPQKKLNRMKKFVTANDLVGLNNYIECLKPKPIKIAQNPVMYRPRIIVPFQLNASAEPDRDSAKRGARMREILASHRKARSYPVPIYL